MCSCVFLCISDWKAWGLSSELWTLLQVSSGKYPGLVWDDEAQTMFRIPWKHAGKQDFRKDEDAAIFKVGTKRRYLQSGRSVTSTRPGALQAWAEFKGKLSEDAQDNPASWKTRLRCALNKSPEFSEVLERAQLDISDPYKVYRLVPLSEQGKRAPGERAKRANGATPPLPRRPRQYGLLIDVLLQAWLFLTTRAESKAPGGPEPGGEASWWTTTPSRRSRRR